MTDTFEEVPRRISTKPAKRASKPGRIKWVFFVLLVLAAGFFASCAFCILMLKWIDPITTSVQAERRLETLLAHKPYNKRYVFVPISRISTDLQHAVVAAEDTRFREHSGVDWEVTQKLIEQDLQTGKLGRGGSTITQQLVKNLFLSTRRSLFRKGLEFILAPMADAILGKRRSLELYLNVIEWGPGIYGAEAASEYWYRKHASQVDRDESARLASIIPNPRKRKPGRTDRYTDIILARMRQMGW
jgi:monofunctional biosynthetic peptidoglycan transglycosylase